MESNWDKDKENYTFPILTPGLNPSPQRDRIKEFVKHVNCK